jgi:hypothetical protein
MAAVDAMGGADIIKIFPLQSPATHFGSLEFFAPSSTVLYVCGAFVSVN